MRRKRVDPSRYHLDTIAGWCLRYAGAYPGISSLAVDPKAAPPWNALYPAAERVISSGLGAQVIEASYAGVLVDEYQDCSTAQHSVIKALSEIVPVRIVGDPLQGVFDFDPSTPIVNWSEVEAFYEELPRLSEPYRWLNAGHEDLGRWIAQAREELQATGSITIDSGCPAKWQRSAQGADRALCWDHRGRTSVAAFNRFTYQSTSLAASLSGTYQLVERFDDEELPKLARALESGTGPEIVASMVNFLSKRVTKAATELGTITKAISQGRSTSRIRKHRAHCDRLEAIAQDPSPQTILCALDGVLDEEQWKLYRPDAIYQLRAALRESKSLDDGQIAEAIQGVRDRVRRRGRHLQRRVLGTALLLKGLEFDTSLVLNATDLSAKELYVAISRGTKALFLISPEPTIRPRR